MEPEIPPVADLMRPVQIHDRCCWLTVCQCHCKMFEAQALLPPGVMGEEVFSKQEVSSVFTLGYPSVRPQLRPAAPTVTAGGVTSIDLRMSQTRRLSNVNLYQVMFRLKKQTHTYLRALKSFFLANFSSLNSICSDPKLSSSMYQNL